MNLYLSEQPVRSYMTLAVMLGLTEGKERWRNTLLKRTAVFS